MLAKTWRIPVPHAASCDDELAALSPTLDSIQNRRKGTPYGDGFARTDSLRCDSDPCAVQNTSMAKTYRLGTSRRTVNALMTALIRIGVGARSSYLLTTTGRKSGKPRTTPVTVVQMGEERWLVAPYGTVAWVHNVRANAGVSLQRGRRTEVFQANEVDAEIAGPVLQRYVREVKVTAPFFDAAADDPVTQFVSEAPRHPVFRLTDVR